MSGIRLSRHFLPAMRAKNWGRVVFISSESALKHSHRDDPLRHDQDGAARGRARGLAQAMAGTGVTVNAVLPGPTRSKGVGDFSCATYPRTVSRARTRSKRSFIAQHRPSSLIRRFATPDEVANMVVFVCSEQASATTGSALRVDGRRDPIHRLNLSAANLLLRPRGLAAMTAPRRSPPGNPPDHRWTWWTWAASCPSSSHPLAKNLARLFPEPPARWSCRAHGAPRDWRARSSNIAALARGRRP